MSRLLIASSLCLGLAASGTAFAQMGAGSGASGAMAPSHGATDSGMVATPGGNTDNGINATGSGTQQSPNGSTGIRAGGHHGHRRQGKHHG
jgi:hypothetical protein